MNRDSQDFRIAGIKKIMVQDNNKGGTK